MYKPNFFVVTGGPGAGKTTVMEELRLRGAVTVAESGRCIIREQLASGGDALPWRNTRKYSELMLQYAIRDFENHKEAEELCFFDRGIPDVLGYSRLIGLNEWDELRSAASCYRYKKRVFLFPPWREIYCTDEERKQDFELAVETCEEMKRTYGALGYTVTPVPLLSVRERADYMLDFLRKEKECGR